MGTPAFLWAIACIGFVGGAAVAFAVAALVSQLRQLNQRLTALEAKPSKHDVVYRAKQDIGEAFLFHLVTLADDAKVLQTRLDYILDIAQHVRNGGSPDDRRSSK